MRVWWHLPDEPPEPAFDVKVTLRVGTGGVPFVTLTGFWQEEEYAESSLFDLPEEAGVVVGLGAQVGTRFRRLSPANGADVGEAA